MNDDDDGLDALLALADNIENAPQQQQQTTTKKRPLPPAVAAPPPRPPPAARPPPSHHHHRDLLQKAHAPAPAPSPQPPQAQHYVTAATGIKLRNPLYGGQDLREMWARLPRGLVPLADAEAAASGNQPSSFVTVGVLVRKEVRRAQGGNGNPYSAWRLADLQGSEATLLLFGDAHERHALRAGEGSVVAATILFSSEGQQQGGGGSGRRWRSSGCAPEEEALEDAEARARGWGGGGNGGGGNGDEQDDDDGLSALLVPELVSAASRRNASTSTGNKKDGPMSVRTGAQLLVLGNSAGFGRCRGVVRATGERCRRAVDTSEEGSTGLCALHAVGQRSALRAELRRVSGPGGVAVASAAAAAAAVTAANSGAGGGGAGGMAGLLAAAAARGGGAGPAAGMRPPFSSAATSTSASSQALLADAQRRRAELAARLQQAGGLQPPPDPNDVSAAALAARDRESTGGGGGAKKAHPQQQQQQRQQQAPRWRQGTAAAAAAALLEGRVPNAAAASLHHRSSSSRPSAAATTTAAASARAALLKQKPGGAGAVAPAPPRPAQPPPPPRGGAGAAAFAAAFGAAVAAAAAAPESDERELAALAGAHADAATNRLLAHYAQKDEIAAQLEATTSVRVEAWRCDTCGPSRGLAPKRGAGSQRECAQAGHRLVKITAVKRWWSCAACGWKLTTLGVLLPTGRCAKCRDPSKQFRAETALGGLADAAARRLGYDAETSAVSAGREAMLPRGTEHAFSLNSLR
jgi:hypothetical protein